MSDDNRPWLTGLDVIAGSAAAGCLSRIPLHPLDTIKSRLQASTGSARAALAGITSARGFTSLYRGFSIAFVGSAPGCALYFGTYDVLKSTFQESPLPQSITHLLSGFGAELVSCVVFVPIDVVKERMQIQHGTSVNYYSSNWDAFRKIWRAEGFRGFYRGYGATLASYGPFSALYFALYEKCKAVAHVKLGALPDSTEPLPFGWQISAACAAGAGASVATSPLDLAKLRLQVQRSMVNGVTNVGAGAGPWGGTQYDSLPHALTEIARSDGFWGLFRGAAARVAFHALSTALTMTMFETCRAAVARML